MVILEKAKRLLQAQASLQTPNQHIDKLLYVTYLYSQYIAKYDEQIHKFHEKHCSKLHSSTGYNLAYEPKQPLCNSLPYVAKTALQSASITSLTEGWTLETGCPDEEQATSHSERHASCKMHEVHPCARELKLMCSTRVQRKTDDVMQCLFEFRLIILL